MPRFRQPDPEQEETTAHLKGQIVALKRQSLSYRDIATRLGYSSSHVQRLYAAALAEVPAEDVVLHRAEECQLAEDAIANLMTIARDTNGAERARVEAWNAICRWSEHRARMRGTNAPTRSVQMTITEDVVDRRIAELNREIAVNDPTAG